MHTSPLLLKTHRPSVGREGKLQNQFPSLSESAAGELKVSVNITNILFAALQPCLQIVNGHFGVTDYEPCCVANPR